MGKFFSDEVEKALELIYYKLGEQRGKEGLALLETAHQNGDGDATYLLSRCYSGPQYVWKYHGFPEDDDKVEQLIHESIRRGSAMGVLGAMRCGELDEQALEEMPFANLKEAFQVIYEKAQGGEPFCQYMVGNVYFWGDVLDIEEEEMQRRAGNKKAIQEFIVSANAEAVGWLEKAFAAGVYFAGNNLYEIYQNGNDGILPSKPEEAAKIPRRGAEYGYPTWQAGYGTDLEEAGNYEQAVYWWKQAYENGQKSVCIRLGKAASQGKGMAKDCKLAEKYFTEGLSEEDYGCYNRLGELYFYGGDGVPQNYARAVELFEEARRRGSNWANDMHAAARIRGLGCAKDAALAKQLVEETDYSSDLKNYTLGVIYAQGLGVPQDIKKGVSYLDKAPNLEWAKEERAKYKRGLFKWTVVEYR